MLEGRPFTLFTDHKPLVGAMAKPATMSLQRQQNQLSYVSTFTTDIRHVKGKDNLVADCLSRPTQVDAITRAMARANPDLAPDDIPLPERRAPRQPDVQPARFEEVQDELHRDGHPYDDAEPQVPPQRAPPAAQAPQRLAPRPAVPQPTGDPLDPGFLAAAQAADPEFAAYRTACTGMRVRQVPVDGHLIWCDTSHGNNRPILPEVSRKTAFLRLHATSHPSVRQTVELVRHHYVWHGLKKQVAQWARQCTGCQRAKIQRHTQAPHEPFPSPSGRFRHVHVDVVGPLPPSEEYRYLLTAID
ncbi:Hypothetical predicted protein, partial [Paramuricea clavata]